MRVAAEVILQACAIHFNLSRGMVAVSAPTREPGAPPRVTPEPPAPVQGPQGVQLKHSALNIDCLCHWAGIILACMHHQLHTAGADAAACMHASPGHCIRGRGLGETHAHRDPGPHFALS